MSGVNRVFLLLVLSAVATGLFRDVAGPPVDGGAVAPTLGAITAGLLDMASTAAKLALGLIGILALWMGVLRVAEAGGLVQSLARLLRPVMVRLFPDVPADHPAMGAMVMNVAANMLGLGNAATPLGLEAMRHLQSLNPDKQTATNAMCLFLAINTSGLTLIPARTIALRAENGAAEPTAILLPTLLATAVSTTVAIVAARLLAPRTGSGQGGDGPVTSATPGSVDAAPPPDEGDAA